MKQFVAVGCATTHLVSRRKSLPLICCSSRSVGGGRHRCGDQRDAENYSFFTMLSSFEDSVSKATTSKAKLSSPIPFSQHVEVVIVALEPERATVVMQSATSSCQEAEFNHVSAIISPEIANLVYICSRSIQTDRHHKRRGQATHHLSRRRRKNKPRLPTAAPSRIPPSCFDPCQ